MVYNLHKLLHRKGVSAGSLLALAGLEEVDLVEMAAEPLARCLCSGA